MPTIIRPNRSGNKALPPPPSTASGTSTHLKALEKVKALPPTVQFSLGGSSSHLADLLDLDASDPSWTTTGSDEPQDYSPPEPCIPPPPAPPVFIFTEASPPPPLAKPEPSAEALYDYASGHPGDLNFKVSRKEGRRRGKKLTGEQSREGIPHALHRSTRGSVGKV